MTIPITTAAFVTDADSRTPSVATAVINQIATTITPKRKAGLEASAGLKMYDAFALITDMIAGRAMTPAIHCSHTVVKPPRSPKATLAHAYTPPVRGQPVASSAATSAVGMSSSTIARA